MAALWVTPDGTVVVWCAGSSDMNHGLVSRSIVRPPVGGMLRPARRVSRVRNETCEHTERVECDRSVAAKYNQDAPRAGVKGGARLRPRCNDAILARQIWVDCHSSCQLRFLFLILVMIFSLPTC